MDYIADSFYHFTPKNENLFSIIKNGFYPRYCKENYDYLLRNYNKLESIFAIPMVCFCDIPIVFIEEHVENYGKFAIAMKKKWGEKHLNPLMYLMDGSIPKNNFVVLQDILFGEKIKQKSFDVKDLFKRDSKLKKIKKMFYHYHDFIAYMKKYKGESIKHDNKEIIFYREREWRWIPKINKEDEENGVILRLDPSDFHLIEKKNKLIEKNKRYRLEFSKDDVDYLIVDSEETKHELEQFLSKNNMPQLVDKVHILEKIINDSKEMFLNKE